MLVAFSSAFSHRGVRHSGSQLVRRAEHVDQHHAGNDERDARDRGNIELLAEHDHRDNRGQHDPQSRPNGVADAQVHRNDSSAIRPFAKDPSSINEAEALLHSIR